MVWGKLGELCGKYLSKGRQVYLEGRLQTRSWEDQKSGQKKYSTEIVANTVQFLGAGGSTGAERSGEPDQASPDVGAQSFAGEPAFDADEEIPF